MSLVNKFGGKNASLPDLRFLLTFLLGFPHRRIIFDKNKTSKNKRVTFGNSGTKTDQHREETIVYISGVSSECCPVKFFD